jgi:hypothetical protein
MKWSSRRPARIDCESVALILFVLALVLLLVMMFSLLAPSQATAGDIVNFRIARRLPASKGMPPGQHTQPLQQMQGQGSSSPEGGRLRRIQKYLTVSHPQPNHHCQSGPMTSSGEGSEHN